MHDGIEIERRGRATAVVLTEPFVAAGEAMKRLDRAPGYRTVVVPHPTAELSGDTLAAVARAAAEQAEAIVSGREGPHPSGRGGA